MMKKIAIVITAFVSLALTGCQTDPWEDIEEGNWNNERSILSLKFENQIGQPVITRTDENTGEIEVSINADAVPDLSSITLEQLVLSYNAKSTVVEGESLNFENENNTSSLVVTSPTGKTREYTIKVNPFQETILGTYQIQDLVLYGGTGPEYGGGGVLSLTSKPWVWPENGPEKELDNYLVFELSGITEEGNTYGTVTNYAGEDETYADFTFVAEPTTDVNHFYRKIPKGQAEWSRNYTNGTITFTFEDGRTTTGTFEGPGTEDLGNGLSKTIENYAFAFNLNGTDDWDNIYSDYDKFVKKPRRYWIDVVKE
ncbi:hypothetical protein OQ279_06820 [Salinimicrobium sp. MT39]|jgi:hypothetical protein|uniref:Uncharacterized protein n=1 Tax=Salinimicrobium profundisediminis TaxID=2994553 RepID=A0A9X3I0W6_9FLAO|nr:hypothetical protein [Salinimicrobium profundisediminis]MCX2837863.1 hypothetical protein [Salinimicrobium profundisediminis]